MAQPGYINDQWILEDSLGMGRAGDALARMALEVQAPFTIGVTGKWGAGKTSVLRRAFATLGGQPISQSLQFGESKTEIPEDELERYRHNNRSDELRWPLPLNVVANQSLAIWYSPWQHQSAEAPIIPLLQEIRAQYGRKRKWLEGVKKLNRQGGLAALTLLEHATDAALSLYLEKPVKLAVGATENVRKAWREEDPDNLTRASDGQRFHLLFEDAVENLLADLVPDDVPFSEQTRLILFIDDLDRCEEKTVVSLLEAIKLYLGTRRCVFVLGVDDVAVADAIKRHWNRPNDDHNREYLEKLFQATLPVPLPRETDLRSLIRGQLASHGFPEPAQDALAEDITRLLEPNPRKVKNFLNSLCAAWTMLRCPALETPENCRRLVMFQYLRQYHRAVWRILERQPELLPVLQRVLTSDGGALPVAGLPDCITQDDLRMTREIFSRSFAHVLRHDNEDGKLQSRPKPGHGGGQLSGASGSPPFGPVFPGLGLRKSRSLGNPRFAFPANPRRGGVVSHGLRSPHRLEYHPRTEPTHQRPGRLLPLAV